MATETSEFWQDMREAERQRLEEVGKENTRIIAEMSSEYPYMIEQMPNSIRLIGEGLKVDIFTKSGKWHNIKTDKRGQFQDCEKFIKSLF
jgi:predicted transcriptional regulator